MAHKLDTKAFLDEVCALLRQGTYNIAIPVAGGSMCPFLHNGDMVHLNLPDRELKRGDIVLYTRENGRYILHRIYMAETCGSYLMVGDAQEVLERIQSRDQIHAIVTSAIHKGKPIRPGQPRWWFYQHIWIRLVPIRRRLINLRNLLRFQRSPRK